MEVKDKQEFTRQENTSDKRASQQRHGGAASMKEVRARSLSRVRLCVTPRTAAPQAPPSMGFSRQEY